MRLGAGSIAALAALRGTTSAAGAFAAGAGAHAAAERRASTLLARPAASRMRGTPTPSSGARESREWRGGPSAREGRGARGDESRGSADESMWLSSRLSCPRVD